MSMCSYRFTLEIPVDSKSPVMKFLNSRLKTNLLEDSLSRRGVSSSLYYDDDKKISHSIYHNETPPSCLGLTEFPLRAISYSESRKRKLEISRYSAVLNSKLFQSTLKHDDDGQNSLSSECVTSRSGHGRKEASIGFAASLHSGSTSIENYPRSPSLSQCSSSSSLSASRHQSVSRSLSRGRTPSASQCRTVKKAKRSHANPSYRSSYSPASEVSSSTYCDSRTCTLSRTDADSDAAPSWNRRHSDKQYIKYLHSQLRSLPNSRNNYSKLLSSDDCVNRRFPPSRFCSNDRLVKVGSPDSGASSTSSNVPVCSTTYSIANSTMHSSISYSESESAFPSTRATLAPCKNTLPNALTPTNKVTPLLSKSSLSLAPVCTSTISSFRRWYSDLPIEFWERSADCKKIKTEHMDRLDNIGVNREQLVLLTTLADEDIVLEKNMFPYDTPVGIDHYTLWSVSDLKHNEIVSFVDSWLERYMPGSRRWQYDDNSGERSVDLFHVHVFIETVPYSFVPHRDKIHIPEHMRVAGEASAV